MKVNPHQLLLIFNVVSLTIILVNAFIVIFSNDIKRGMARKALLANMSAGFMLRLAALYITLVILGTNSIG